MTTTKMTMSIVHEMEMRMKKGMYFVDNTDDTLNEVNILGDDGGELVLDSANDPYDDTEAQFYDCDNRSRHDLESSDSKRYSHYNVHEIVDSDKAKSTHTSKKKVLTVRL
ncbi:uncharacterized protein EV154DRAFT_563071 [Mucor mucedo]|uniref:uncharacterized protein n=1 Tax=Mucor mucedo TaxID=29922 RepID=UPI00221E8175|nr:uncharacterized protein EV154DRAFT_563071 [Mucor mucedo]KAI7891814.1 hypothetical protein EV154DRAFT_563071 [Mucor mucedo]